MKLYHGTSLSAWNDIKESGEISPRALSTTHSKSNWADHPASEYHVYLTDTYATYFADRATSEHESELAVIIELDVDPDSLFPDEDFLEAATRSSSDFEFVGETLAERTAWFKENLELFSDHTMDSLENLGTVAHEGSIELGSVSRVVAYNPMPLVFAFDPTITMMNHKFCGAHHASAMPWLFDNEPVADMTRDIPGVDSAERDESWKRLRNDANPEIIFEGAA